MEDVFLKKTISIIEEFSDDSNFGTLQLAQTIGMSESQLYRKLKALTLAKENGGYIYHSDHSVPDNVSFSRYRRVIELVHKYGSYA